MAGPFGKPAVSVHGRVRQDGGGMSNEFGTGFEPGNAGASGCGCRPGNEVGAKIKSEFEFELVLVLVLMLMLMLVLVLVLELDTKLVFDLVLECVVARLFQLCCDTDLDLVRTGHAQPW